MVLAPYLFALIWSLGSGNFHPAVAILGPAWLLGYFAFFATGQWLKSRFKGRYLKAVMTYGATTAMLSAVVVALRPDWAAWAIVFVPLTAAGLWFSWARNERCLTSDLVTVAAASALPLVIGSAGPLTLSADARIVGVAVVCFSYFFGTVFYVKTNIRQRGRLDYLVYSVAWHLACTVLMAFVDFGLSKIALTTFFAAMTVRAWLVPWRGAMRGRPVTARVLGRWEIVATLVLVAILIPHLLTSV